MKWIWRVGKNMSAETFSLLIYLDGNREKNIILGSSKNVCVLKMIYDMEVFDKTSLTI